jgi:DNA-binding transcriptional ArsR family regulator
VDSRRPSGLRPKTTIAIQRSCRYFANMNYSRPSGVSFVKLPRENLPLRTVSSPLREANRRRVVEELRRHGNLSRADLARLMGLSPTTITALVADLRARGLVVEESERIEQAGRGRPPVLLRLDPSAGGALGIDFGHRHLRVAVADLSRTVLAERATELDVGAAAQGALDAAAAMVEDVLSEAGMDRDRIVGAGVGLPGPIDAGREPSAPR